jgi:hypothetical protein
MTIRIEMELDVDAYNAKYGPGSEWAEKYGTGLTDHMEQNPEWLKEAIEDVLNEGFYDWHSQGWMRLQILSN